VTGGVAAHAAPSFGSGWLHVKNQGSAKCVDVRDQSDDPGALLRQVGCKDIDGQQFELGAQMNYCSGVPKQRFHLVRVSDGPVVYYALEPAHVNGFCLRADPRGPTTNTALILQFQCNGDPAEHWNFYRLTP
jgi:hypothetical protein